MNLSGFVMPLPFLCQENMSSFLPLLLDAFSFVLQDGNGQNVVKKQIYLISSFHPSWSAYYRETS